MEFAYALSHFLRFKGFELPLQTPLRNYIAIG
jgi:hypothetical protein